jgi:hypothetical protein
MNAGTPKPPQNPPGDPKPSRDRRERSGSSGITTPDPIHPWPFPMQVAGAPPVTPAPPDHAYRSGDAIAVRAGDAIESAIVAQLVPAAEIH